MKFILIFMCSLFSNLALAESKTTADVSIDKLTFKRPTKGVGIAGELIFRSANVNNNGIILNLKNENHFFDSKIFQRPTFLGFSTQFGNYGFSIEKDNIINTLDKAELLKSKLVLDENQLNLSGEYFSFINYDSSVILQNFLFYCQKISNNDSSRSDDMMAHCLRFLTFNGNYTPNNETASFHYESEREGEKTSIKAQVLSFDLRNNQINASLKSAKTANNELYFIEASDLNLNCEKDENLKTLDFDKIKKDCLNRINISHFDLKLNDRLEKSAFNLDIKDFTVKEKIVYLTLNHGTLSDPSSSTYIHNVLVNCRKEIETDLFNLSMVLKDCLTYSRLKIEEIKNSKPDVKESSIRNISINSTNGALVIQAETSFLGIKAHVVIYGNASLNEQKKILIINVTNTKLPFGLSSVHFLMYILKKNIISKEVAFQNNSINIQY